MEPRRLLAAVLRTTVLALALLIAPQSSANDAQPNRIDIEYAAPKSPDHEQLFMLLRERDSLERIRDLLAPIRLPRRLLLKTEGCDGVANAWYDGEAVVVCYEYLDDIWKNVPETTTPEGVSPIDALIGPLVDVFLHEVAHAVFDMLNVPLFGREEDAADQFSTFIMLRFKADEARRLILGNAYQYRNDLQSPSVSFALKKFADTHGTPAQRYYNVLCMAYGANKELFADFADKGMLPKERSDGCEDEYRQVAHAFERLIAPSIDPALVRQMHESWLPPIDTKPKRRQ